MLNFHRSALVFGLCVLFALGAASIGLAQAAPKPATTTTPATGGEKTVEEAYLQASLEALIINEQSKADSRDMKALALKYVGEALAAGHKTDDIRKSLEYLALESTYTISRSAGLGRPINDFPDIRAQACDYLGEFPTVEAKDALIKVALADTEPWVLSSAVRSLGKIGMNDNDEVVQVISYIINRFDVLMPDNSLAFECIVALEKIAQKNGGIKDPATLRAVIRIRDGLYVQAVKIRAADLVKTILKYSAASGSGK